MMPGSRMPLITKIYLALLIYLSVLLVILIMLRLSDVELNWQRVQALLPGGRGAETAEQTTTPQPVQALEPTFPAGVPWLQAVADTSIFSTPGSASPPVAILVTGQTAQVIGVSQDRQWWAIRMPYFENGQGWVAAAQVNVQNADQVSVIRPAGAPNTASRPTEQMPVALAVANVNVRNGPDMRFDKIGLLKNGEEAEIVGISPDGLWWAIRLPGDDQRTGWVAKDYIVSRNDDNIPVLSLESNSGSGTAASPQPGRAALTAAWTVNIRAGPGKQYAIVGTLQQGQTAEIVGVSEDTIWWAIRFESSEGDTGWVAAAYVEAVNAQNVPVLK